MFRDKAVSGRRSRRRGLQQLRQVLMAGDVDVLIVFSTNRLFRKMYRSLQFVEEEVVERGIRCVFISNNIDTDDSGRWRQALGFSSMMDEFMVQGMASHIQAAHETMLIAGRVCTTLAFGYRGEELAGVKTKRGRPGTRVVVDAEQAVWVKRVFAWFVVDGLSIAEIVRKLNQQQAPLPPKATNSRWTYQAVRRLLANERYRGYWAYGRTMSVWQSSKDYVRQVPREEALRTVQIEELRLIDEGTWHAAQAQLYEYRNRVGRRKKASGRRDVGCILSGLLICREHQRPLTVAGTNGRFWACPECKEDGQGALFSLLRRDLALEMLCERLAVELLKSEQLIEDAVAAARQKLVEFDRPEPSQIAKIQARIRKLTSNIQFVLSSPGETNEDQAENRLVVQRLRGERSRLQSELAAQQAAAKEPAAIPTQEALRSQLFGLAAILRNAANSGTDRDRQAVRSLIMELTGGKVVMTQQGERRKYRGWLRGEFEFCGAPVLAGSHRRVQLELDFRSEPST